MGLGSILPSRQTLLPFPNNMIPSKDSVWFDLIKLLGCECLFWKANLLKGVYQTCVFENTRGGSVYLAFEGEKYKKKMMLKL